MRSGRRASTYFGVELEGRALSRPRFEKNGLVDMNPMVRHAIVGRALRLPFRRVLTPAGKARPISSRHDSEREIVAPFVAGLEVVAVHVNNGPVGEVAEGRSLVHATKVGGHARLAHFKWRFPYLQARPRPRLPTRVSLQSYREPRSPKY